MKIYPEAVQPIRGNNCELIPVKGIPMLEYWSFLARLIAVASTVYTCLVCNSSIVATCPSIPAARFAFRLFYSFCFSCS